MRVSLDIPVEDFAESIALELDRDDLLNLLCEIDIKIADVGFTEELIVRLATGLRGDLDDAAFAELASKLGAAA